MLSSINYTWLSMDPAVKYELFRIIDGSCCQVKTLRDYCWIMLSSINFTGLSVNPAVKYELFRIINGSCCKVQPLQDYLWIRLSNIKFTGLSMDSAVKYKLYRIVDCHCKSSFIAGCIKLLDCLVCQNSPRLQESTTQFSSQQQCSRQLC